MRFRNSIGLLMENFHQVYKLLLYKLIIALVSVALCVAFVLPELLSFWRSEAVQAFMADLQEFFKFFMHFDRAGMEAIKGEILGANGSFGGVVTLVSSMTFEIVLTCVGLTAVYLVRRFAETLCHFATGSMLNDKMSTYAETSFTTSSVANLGKASVYALVYVPAVFVFDILMLAVVYALLSFLPIIAGLFCAMTWVVFCQALKLTLTANWMPAMTTDNMRLRDALRARGEQNGRQRWHTFSMYIVSVYAVIIINVAAAVCTFGSALLITVPCSYFLFICEQYVNYYTVKGKKYFITYDSIASSTDRGDTEHFFEYLETKPENEETAENTTEDKENQ